MSTATVQVGRFSCVSPRQPAGRSSAVLAKIRPDYRGARQQSHSCRAAPRQTDDSGVSLRRALLLSGLTGGLLSSVSIGPANAADFAELQAEKAARKQAILEAARAKATGEPLPDVPDSEPAEAVTAPDTSSLDVSNLSYPADPPAEKAATSKEASNSPPARKKAASKAKASKEKKEENDSFVTFDKKSLAKERALRKAELLEKARAKALQDAASS